MVKLKICIENLMETRHGVISLKKLSSLKILLFVIVFFTFVCLIPAQQPSLHSLQGYVFHADSSHAQSGTKVRINTSTTTILTQTSGPPANTGFYAASINAADSELVTVTAYNSTAWGRNTTLLLASPSTTRMNITLVNTRPSERDIDITTANNSIYERFRVFNITFNSTAIGGANSLNCNATIAIANENIINITGNRSKNIGNISLGSTNSSFFEVRALNEGNVNINITTICGSDSENFEGLNIDYLTLRVAQQPPQLHTVQGYIFNIDNVTQAPSGTNVTINATQTGSVVNVLTSGPPGHTGFYSTTINALDGETMIVSAQNGTYRGIKNFVLESTPTTTRVNVSLDTKIIGDLAIYYSDIIFESINIENVNTTINATIRNVGQANVGSFVVQFFRGDPDAGGVQINGNKTISSLGIGQSIVVSVNYTTIMGSNNIFVVLDPPLVSNGSILEDNETNNEANNSFNITAWQNFYGNISIDKLLGNNLTKNLSIWYNELSLSGNVFVSDTESNIDWRSLQSIGKNITGGNTVNDFSDIDSILNMVSFSDSVSNIFTSDGNTPHSFSDFLAYQQEIQNVAVINSTNTANFITGILWDGSDDIGDGQYSQDDREDLIFVTKVNQSQQGAYGTYDYEIKIPARLREYSTAETNNVFIYFDIN